MYFKWQPLLYTYVLQVGTIAVHVLQVATTAVHILQVGTTAVHILQVVTTAVHIRTSSGNHCCTHTSSGDHCCTHTYFKWEPLLYTYFTISRSSVLDNLHHLLITLYMRMYCMYMCGSYTNSLNLFTVISRIMNTLKQGQLLY